MKKVIVTGANGFIGTALCKAFSNRNIEVIAVIKGDDENCDTLKKLKNVKLVFCDLKNYCDLAQIIRDRNIDVFFHFAWIGTSGALRGNLNAQLTNIKSTCDAIEACSKIGCNRFVFASSIMVYEIEALMQTDLCVNINTLYQSAKLSADYFAKAIANHLGIDYVRTVISNIYGPGEFSKRFIITTLDKMLKGEYCSFSAGDQLYDFIYITDAAEAFVEIGQSGKKNKTYYVGSKKPKPLKEFILDMRDCIDSNIEIGLGELPFNGVSLSYDEFDIDAVENDTGFVPKIDFNTGITETIKWLKEQNNAGI